jgi:hypothetical protein
MVAPATPDATPGRLAFLVEWTHQHGWMVLVLSLLFGGVAHLVLTRVGDPVVVKAINVVLDEIRDGLWGDLDEDVHHHRVTLFKRKPFRLGFLLDDGGRVIGKPWSGWLVPVARSGYATQRMGEHPPGRIWGVLVLDSRDPEPDYEKARQLHREYANVLGTLVAGA